MNVNEPVKASQEASRPTVQQEARLEALQQIVQDAASHVVTLDEAKRSVAFVVEHGKLPPSYGKRQELGASHWIREVLFGVLYHGLDVKIAQEHVDHILQHGFPPPSLQEELDSLIQDHFESYQRQEDRFAENMHDIALEYGETKELEKEI